MEQLPIYLGSVIVILLFSSFIKIATSLAILRFGLGLDGITMGLVTLTIALGLSVLLVDIKLRPDGGLSGLVQAGNWSIDTLDKKFTPFLEANTDQNVKQKLIEISNKLGSSSTPKSVEPEPGSGPEQKTGDSITTSSQTPGSQVREFPFSALAAAFLISEIREAFYFGLVLLIPFVVIDILVVNILMVLSITQISHQVIALPLKLLLFVGIDGWVLVTDKLLASYA